MMATVFFEEEVWGLSPVWFTGHQCSLRQWRLSTKVLLLVSLCVTLRYSASLRFTCFCHTHNAETQRAAELFYFFLVAAAFLAERERDLADRFLAALRACRESARFVAALRPSRFKALSVACERFRDFLVAARFAPLRLSRFACSLVSSEAFSVGGRSTPARRAFDNPIAIACLVERAPCFPSRMCSISSRTNSPACVLGALPSRLSRRARSIVSFSGMCYTP